MFVIHEELVMVKTRMEVVILLLDRIFSFLNMMRILFM